MLVRELARRSWPSPLWSPEHPRGLPPQLPMLAAAPASLPLMGQPVDASRCSEDEALLAHRLHTCPIAPSTVFGAGRNPQKDLAIFLFFADGSLSVGRLPRSFSWTYSIHASSTPAPRLSDPSSLASMLARRWGLLGCACTALGQSSDGIAEKYTARSYP
jgi:hypothetical protein